MVFLVGDTVAMVTYCCMKMIVTCSPMNGQFCVAVNVASVDKEWLK